MLKVLKATSLLKNQSKNNIRLKSKVWRYERFFRTRTTEDSVNPMQWAEGGGECREIQELRVQIGIRQNRPPCRLSPRETSLLNEDSKVRTAFPSFPLRLNNPSRNSWPQEQDATCGQREENRCVCGNRLIKRSRQEPRPLWDPPAHLALSENERQVRSHARSIGLCSRSGCLSLSQGSDLAQARPWLRRR